jgi:hypothetical protein
MGWHHDLLLWADHGGGTGPTTTRYIRGRSAAACTSRSTTIGHEGSVMVRIEKRVSLGARPVAITSRATSAPSIRAMSMVGAVSSPAPSEASSLRRVSAASISSARVDRVRLTGSFGPRRYGQPRTTVCPRWGPVTVDSGQVGSTEHPEAELNRGDDAIGAGSSDPPFDVPFSQAGRSVTLIAEGSRVPAGRPTMTTFVRYCPAGNGGSPWEVHAGS